MARSVANHKALSGASKSAGRALEALSDPQWAHIPREEVVAWAMAAVIHCDMCRLVVSLDECEPGIASLLAMSDVVSKLYEIKRWYLGQGAKALRKIACTKSCGIPLVDERLRQLKSLHPIGSVDKPTIATGSATTTRTTQWTTLCGSEKKSQFISMPCSLRLSASPANGRN